MNSREVIKEIDSPAAQWIANDALRELNSPVLLSVFSIPGIG